MTSELPPIDDGARELRETTLGAAKEAPKKNGLRDVSRRPF